MLDQHTMQQGLDLIDKYGPVTGLIIYTAILSLAIIAWNIYQQFRIKKDVRDPLGGVTDRIKSIEDEVVKLRVARGDLLERIQANELQRANESKRLELMINDRVRHEWAEQHLIPKIEKLSEDVTRFSANVDHQARTIEGLASAVKHLTDVLEAHANRLATLEHK